MESITKRLNEAMRIRGMRQADIIEKTGLSSPSMSQWLSGRNEPKRKAISILASALDVRPDWLMGLDVPMEVGLTIDVTKAESLLVTDYRKLDEADRNKLQGFLVALLSDEKYAKKRTVG